MSESFPEEALWELINSGGERMTQAQRGMWEAIRVSPALWALPGYGPFWVVGLIGARVVYYNHIEDGFNASGWSTFGTIDHYQSLQGTLDEAIQRQLDIIAMGCDAGPWSGPPVPGIYSGKR